MPLLHTSQKHRNWTIRNVNLLKKLNIQRIQYHKNSTFFFFFEESVKLTVQKVPALITGNKWRMLGTEPFDLYVYI